MGNLIVKDNALIEASHKLSETEQRLILLAILKAREFCDSVEQLKEKELVIHADDYINAFNVDKSTAYRMLKQAVLGLYRAEWGYHYINTKGNAAVRYERFTQSAEYIENEATVKFMFSNAIIPMLVELERSFTSYEIEQVAHLQSRYAMRLYESLIRFKTNNVLKITLEELRFRFGLLEHEYKRMGDFKKDVLDLAVKQINDNTDLKVSYEQHKQGRTITGFTFNFKQKTKPKTAKDSQNERDPNTIDVFTGKTDSEIKKAPVGQNKGLSDGQISKLKVFAQEFCDANSSKMPENFRGGYNELIDSWAIMLKNPNYVHSFKKVQELLERSRN